MVIGGNVESANHLLGFAAVVTAAFAGAARYAMVLTDADERQVERATAVGFFSGGSIGALMFLLDNVLNV
jgi:hypothetical protein